MHETMTQFCQSLELKNKHETARTYGIALELYSGWLGKLGLDALHATTDDIRAFQRWLCNDYRSSSGQPLERVTQATRLSGVKAYYRWLERRGLILSDVARKVELPRVSKRVTTRDYLTLQEATAMVQTQARAVLRFREGSFRWAKETEGLAILCIALATGRRRRALLALRVSDLNFPRNEIRIEREKGKAGRVLPVARWAMTAAQAYVEKARPVLNWHPEENPWLFVGDKSPQYGEATLAQFLERIHKQTVAENPDLEELATKHLTPHSLRVSFATLLFRRGCNIRSVNELMDHDCLSTTARYTPVPLEDLRRACGLAHPRA